MVFSSKISGLTFPPPGDLPNLGIELPSAGGFLTTEPSEKPNTALLTPSFEPIETHLELLTSSWLVQSLSCVWLFATPWTAARQAFLFITSFQSLLKTQVHLVSDAIQPSHPLLSPFPPAFHLSQHQGLFKWVRSAHQVAKVLEFQLQHQSFQWTFRTDFL